MTLLNLGKVRLSKSIDRKSRNNFRFLILLYIALQSFENGIFDDGKREEHISEIENGEDVSAVYDIDGEKIRITSPKSRQYTKVRMG